MGLIIDNVAKAMELKGAKAIPITNSVVAALMSRDLDEREEVEDKVVDIIVNLLGLYKGTIFPSVGRDIKSTKKFVEEMFEKEVMPEVTILEKEIAPIFLVAYDEGKLNFNHTADRPNNVMLANQFQISKQSSTFKSYLETVSNKDINQVWSVLGKIINGEVGIGYLLNDTPVANALQIAVAISYDLDEREPLTGTMGTSGEYNQAINFLIATLSTLLHKDIFKTSGMTDNKILTYGRINKGKKGHVYILALKSSLMSYYKSGGTIEGIYGAESRVNDVQTLLDNRTVNEEKWRKVLLKATAIKRSMAYKVYVAGYDDLVNSWIERGVDIPNRDELRVIYTSKSDADISRVKDVISEMYGKSLYPESGFSRFSSYMEQYKESVGGELNELATLATTEMVVDYLLSEIIISG